MQRNNEKLHPTLRDVRRLHDLTSQSVADAAGVPLRTEYLMEIGGVVSREDAEKVMTALSTLTQYRYTLDTINGIALRETLHV